MNAQTNQISLSSSAVLIDLSISTFSGKKQDREVSNEIDQAKHTQVKAGAYQKNLLAGSEELNKITAHAAAVRRWHTQATLPWSDLGTRLLPTASLINYSQTIGQHEAEFNRLVGLFCSAYPLLIQAAQFRLGALFRASDYPDPSEIPGKFSFNYIIAPVPEQGDFRVDIGREAGELLAEQLEKANQKRMAAAMQDVRERVKGIMTQLSNQLREDGRIYQSVLDTALALCDSLTGFNLEKDQELEELRKALRGVVLGIDPKEMKKDPALRKSAKSELDALLGKINF